MAAIKIAIQDHDALQGSLCEVDGAAGIKLVLGEAELTLKLEQAHQVAALLQDLHAIALARQKEAPAQMPRPAEPFVAGVNCDAQECPYVNARRNGAPGDQPLEICKTCGMPVRSGG